MLIHVPYALSSPQTVIAWQGNRPRLNHEFQQRIQAYRILFDQTSGNKFALYYKDSFEFSCALIGGWLAKKVLYLPNDILPKTCANLQNSVDGFLGEFPEEYLTLFPAEIKIDQKINTDKFIEDYEAVVLYTSGSTGEAQAIPKKISQLFAEITTLEKLFGSIIGTSKTEVIATVSHEHIYGLLFKILWPLWCGRIIHLSSALFLEELIPLLSTRDCVLITTPAHLKRFDSDKNFPNQTIRAIFSSAGPLSFEVAQATAKLLGKFPIEIYGSTETGGIAWRQRKEATDEKWLPLSGVNWRISSDEKVLEINSPHLSDNNWFRTADTAISLEEGFVLQKRIDRIVKLEGKRISLTAIEQCLFISELVAEARVIMVDNQTQRQHIAAFIILTKEGQEFLINKSKKALNQQLRGLLVKTIDAIALPRVWRYLEKFPIDGQGKITHSALMNLLEKKPIMPLSRCVEKEETRVLLELTLPDDLFYFAGHFPEAPILPGVVQVDWAIHYGREYFHLPVFFQKMQKLKFQQVITPDMIVLLELKYEVAQVMLEFCFYSGKKSHSSGRIFFRSMNDSKLMHDDKIMNDNKLMQVVHD